MSTQIVKTGSSCNRIYWLDENGQRVMPPIPFEEWGIVFVDRDGSKHSYPTEAHKGAIVLPARKWEELNDAEKESERKRWGGLWPL